ncbi:MAG TPA: oligoendopeptidase F [Planctomycetota bacterium]|nr:oligoendopeptidase F [Planctomycetota bacterium]
MAATTVPVRAEIPIEQTWDAQSVYPTDSAWEAAIASVEARIPKLKAFSGRLKESPDALLEYLQLSESVSGDLGKIRVYATMFEAVDTSDASALAKRDRAMSIASQAGAAMAFDEPEMIAIGFETLKSWMQSNSKLAVYKLWFEKLEKRQAHVRSGEVEELLTQAAQPLAGPHAAHGALTNADLKFAPARGSNGETHEVSQGSLGALVTHPDREVRRTAWESYADGHLQFKNTMAACISAGVKRDVFYMRARKYNSCLEAALESAHIPAAVFHNLINTFKKNLPTWHRYWRVRRKALKLDTLHRYDTFAPLTNNPPHITWDQSISWICEGMRPLGEDYVSVMRRGLVEQRWVDWRPNRGKRAGAFSMGVVGTHPFILMSYNDDIFSLSTLAHELGHSMHKHYTTKCQPFVYANYGLFAAEVASNFNQAMVRAHLLNTNKERDFQIAVIEEAMANFHRYFFIMPTLARFELEIHERAERGEPLTAKSMNALMADLFTEGFGDDVAMDRKRIGITWAQFATHMYANFYVYQYATGISGAHALCARVLDKKPDAQKNYLAFLSAGSSLYPLDALKLAGVDLASSEPVEQTFAVLAGYVQRLEELLA